MNDVWRGWQVKKECHLTGALAADQVRGYPDVTALHAIISLRCLKILFL